MHDHDSYDDDDLTGLVIVAFHITSSAIAERPARRSVSVLRYCSIVVQITQSDHVIA